MSICAYQVEYSILKHCCTCISNKLKMLISVIVSEGYMAPFIGFIKTGECHILRQVEVMHTLPNGKRVGLVKSTS